MTETTVTHYVEVDMDGEELDCLEDCPGCAAQRVRAYLAQREPMQHLGDRIHETNGGEDAGGATLYLDDLRVLVEGVAEKRPSPELEKLRAELAKANATIQGLRNTYAYDND